MSITFNPFTGTFDFTRSSDELDDYFLKIDQTTPQNITVEEDVTTDSLDVTVNFDYLTFNFLGLIDAHMPVMKGKVYTDNGEDVATLGGLGFNNRVFVIDYDGSDTSEIKFSKTDFTNSASMVVDFANSYFLFDWSIVPGDDASYSFGTSDYRWLDAYFSGDIYLDSDSSELFFGDGQDMKILYDGTSGYILTDLVNPSDLHIDCGTDKTVVLDESVWDDVQFPIATGKVPAANYPSFEAFTTNTQAFAFSVNDYIDLESEELPHGWKEGTNGSVHLHFANKAAQNSGSSQYAKFTVWIAYADATEVYAETSFDMECEIPNGTSALTHFLCVSSTAFTLTNNKIGTQMVARVKRIAATGGTEYGDDVYITQTGVHVEHDTVGSRQLSTK